MAPRPRATRGRARGRARALRPQRARRRRGRSRSPDRSRPSVVNRDSPKRSVPCARAASDAERAQHVGRLDAAGRAGRARRHRQSVEAADASVSSAPSIDTFRLCGRRASSEPLTWTPSIARAQAGEQAIAQRREPRRLGRHLRARRSPRRAPKPDDPRRVQRARAAARARGRRRRRAAPAAPSAAGCARRARRRPAGRGSCAPRSTARSMLHRADVERDLAEGLRRVGVEQDAARRGSARPIAASGCSTPISLLAAITLTRIVRGSSAASSAARSISPSGADRQAP